MKVFLIILLAAAVLGGGYWLLRANNIYIFTPDPSNPDAKGFVRGMTDLLDGAKSAAGRLVSQGRGTAEKTSKQALDVAAKKGESIVKQGKDALTEKLKTAVADAFISVVDEARTFLGITTNTDKPETISPNPLVVGEADDIVSSGSATLTTSFLGTVIKRGQTLTFVVSEELFKKNNVNEISYSVLWGDGVREYKRLFLEEKNKFIAHTYGAAGEYKPLFSFDVGKNKIRHEITVIVEE